MGAAAKFHLLCFFNVVSEYLFAPRTDKRVMRRRIEHQDEIGKVVDKAASKLLLLVEPALHLATLGNVHDRALVSHDATAVIANGASPAKANHERTLLADQRNLTPLKHGL